MPSITVSPRLTHRVAQVALGLIFLNILSGAAVRLSDSGLGCPDWPTCTHTHLTAPLAGHAGIEFGNRLVVVALVVATAAAFLAAWWRSPRRRDLTWLAGGLVGGVLAEALVGGLVVYTKLNAYVVMAHFMVGMILLADALVLVIRARRPDGPPIAKVDRGLILHSRVLVGWLFVVLIAGTATTGAGPHAGGKGAKRVPLPLIDVVRIHSILVETLLIVTVLLLVQLYRKRAPDSVQERGRLLLAGLVVQGAIGYTQYFTHLPALLVWFHVGGAATVWSLALWFYAGLFHHRWISEPEPSPLRQQAATALPSTSTVGAGTVHATGGRGPGSPGRWRPGHEPARQPASGGHRS